MTYFHYDEQAIGYLKSKDKKLADAIERIGLVYRVVNPNLFCALVNAIVGQQIAQKAKQTVWQNLLNHLGEINTHTILAQEDDDLQKLGLSFRKVGYIKNLARKVANNSLLLQELHTMSNEEVCDKLMALNGIGRWTAEMILLFSLQRMDVFSQGDFAIKKGLCLLHNHSTIDKALYEKYRRRYSPYGSVASLYLWEIANGAFYK